MIYAMRYMNAIMNDSFQGCVCVCVYAARMRISSVNSTRDDVERCPSVTLIRAHRCPSLSPSSMLSSALLSSLPPAFIADIVFRSNRPPLSSRVYVCTQKDHKQTLRVRNDMHFENISQHFSRKYKREREKGRNLFERRDACSFSL